MCDQYCFVLQGLARPVLGRMVRSSRRVDRYRQPALIPGSGSGN